MKFRFISVLLLLSLLCSCNRTDLVLSDAQSKVAYTELGHSARYSVHLMGDYQKMAGDIDSLLSYQIDGWKKIDEEHRRLFKQDLKNKIRSQMDNDSWEVYKSAVYQLSSTTGVLSPIKIQVVLGQPLDRNKTTGVLEPFVFGAATKAIDHLTLVVPISIVLSNEFSQLGELNYKQVRVLETDKEFHEFTQ